MAILESHLPSPPASPYLCSFLLKFLNGSLIDASALVDEVARGGGLARVHMADHNNVDVEFLFSHGDRSWLKLLINLVETEAFYALVIALEAYWE